MAGTVREPGSTRPAAHALVTGRACNGIDSALVFTNEQGEYELRIDAGSGPDLVDCAIIDATLGGARATVNASGVHFVNGQPQRFMADITLNPLPPLTRSEAARLIDGFVELLNGNGQDEVRLATYARGGPESLRTAVEDYRSLLGDRIAATYTSDTAALLRGTRGAELSVSVDQDLVRRLHGPVLDYSLRSRLFVASFSRLVSSGDAEALARLLTADDVDYPVENARRVITRFQPPFEAAGGQYELIAVDERRNTLTYRVTWRNEKQSKSADVVLRYGDGLLGLVENEPR